MIFLKVVDIIHMSDLNRNRVLTFRFLELELQFEWPKPSECTSLVIMTQQLQINLNSLILIISSKTWLEPRPIECCIHNYAVHRKDDL